MKLCTAALLAYIASAITVSVVYPPDLQQRYSSGLPATFPRFGQMPYGTFIEAKVVKVGPDCCSMCRPRDFDAAVPSVFLVPQGNCTFDSTVHYAEVAGALAVVIYNPNSLQRVSLMDTANYSRTSIPAVLIDNSTAQDILNVHGDVVLNITFVSASLTQVVEVGVVYALENTLDLQVVPLLPTVLAFWPSVVMKLYFSLYRYPENSSLRSNLDCICNNLYCSPQHSQGRFVVQESVRQQCVFQSSNNSYSHYVDYMAAWAQYCSFEPRKECEMGYLAAGVATKEVQKCYLDSFGGDEKSNYNTILEEAQYGFEGLELSFTPAVIVGREIMYGDFSPASLKRMICAHLSVPHAKCAHYFCAPGCWQNLLSNLLCDPACNVEACGFDSGACSKEDPLAPFHPAKPGPDPPPGNSSNECSPGCGVEAWSSAVCEPACNNSLCSYQNWTCACAYHCAPELLQNDECDSSCNTALCDFDNGFCPRINIPVDPSDADGANFFDTNWKKGLIIASICTVFM